MYLHGPGLRTGDWLQVQVEVRLLQGVTVVFWHDFLFCKRVPKILVAGTFHSVKRYADDTVYESGANERTRQLVPLFPLIYHHFPSLSHSPTSLFSEMDVIDFFNSHTLVREMLHKDSAVNKGKFLEEASIESQWLR